MHLNKLLKKVIIKINFFFFVEVFMKSRSRLCLDITKTKALFMLRSDFKLFGCNNMKLTFLFLKLQ